MARKAVGRAYNSAEGLFIVGALLAFVIGLFVPEIAASIWGREVGLLLWFTVPIWVAGAVLALIGVQRLRAGDENTSSVVGIVGGAILLASGVYAVPGILVLVGGLMVRPDRPNEAARGRSSAA